MLTAADDNKISDQDPGAYFPQMPKKIRTGVFTPAFIPKEFADGSKPFAEFVSKRAELLARAAEQLIAEGRPAAC